MTEKELIARQEAEGNTVFYLLKAGMFYHAYEGGAFALARLMNYRVKRKQRKGATEVLLAGFPVTALPRVLERMKQNGWVVACEQEGDDRLFRFSGADGTSENALIDDGSFGVASRREPDTEKFRKLKARILSFDPGSSTPMEALNFIDRLQKTLREADICPPQPEGHPSED